jgi:hypothetical protein
MNMSQCGGYLLSGIKLCPLTGQKNDLHQDTARRGGRRVKKSKKNSGTNNNNTISKTLKNAGQISTIIEGRESKRAKLS